MSRSRPDLFNDKKTADKYISWLKKIKYIKEIYLAGSRAKGTEKENSDWDIVILVDRKLKLPKPRKQFKFHCDLKIIQDRKFIKKEYKLIK